MKREQRCECWGIPRCRLFEDATRSILWCPACELLGIIEPSDDEIRWRRVKSSAELFNGRAVEEIAAQLKRRSDAARSHVYFLLAESIGAVKIGTAVDVARRMKNIRTILPVETKIVRVIQGDRRTEIFMHGVLAPFRVRGEWFHWSPVNALLRAFEGVAP